MSKNDGGAAFPRNAVPPAAEQSQGFYRITPFIPAQDGMTLRDYFAAAALQAMLQAPDTKGWDFQTVSVEAYEAADAMLAERAK